jgi:hypothetical protein
LASFGDADAVEERHRPAPAGSGHARLLLNRPDHLTRAASELYWDETLEVADAVTLARTLPVTGGIEGRDAVAALADRRNAQTWRLRLRAP